MAINFVCLGVKSSLVDLKLSRFQIAPGGHQIMLGELEFGLRGPEIRLGVGMIGPQRWRESPQRGWVETKTKQILPSGCTIPSSP